MFSFDSLHGRVIDYNCIKNIPGRNAFLNQDTYKQINNDISSTKPLLFMPNDLHETHLQDKKYSKSEYRIALFGVLLDGRRATVVIKGIKPYFEVRMVKNSKECDLSADAEDLYDKLKEHKYASPESYEIFKAKKFKGFSETRSTYVRFYFLKLKTRREAIKEVRNMGFETTSDDTSCYYRLVCRDYLTTFSSWVYLSDYKIRTYSSIRGTVFEVDITNYKPCTEDITANPLLAKDNLMSMCWDIETYSPDGDLPRPENPDNRMFMIGVTFQWHHGNDQLLRVCLVDHPCDPRPNYLTVVCEDEKKLIKAFGKLAFKMKPEFFLGFNDSDYDWPWLIKRGNAYKGVLTFLAECFDATIHWKNYDDKDIFAYNFKKEKVKLEADAYAEGQTLVFPGYINIDIRTIFRQLYPTEEKSNLNFYLALNKLGSKKDMPYQEMFKAYGEMDAIMNKHNNLTSKPNNIKVKSFLMDNDIQCADIILNYIYTDEFLRLKDTMAEIADYCVIDSQRCHELMKIRSVIMDRREVANLSYTSVFDSLYRANGMKVRNLVIARGQLMGIRFSNITNSGDVEDGKYPGAYVFPPVKGLVISKLTMDERKDNAHLMDEHKDWIDILEKEMNEFKEIINTYGACVSQEVIELISKKHTLKKCFIDFLIENIGRPITGLDFSSLYPSLIMAYNLSPEYIITNQKDARLADAAGHTLHKIKFNYNGRIIRGWSVRHDNKLDPKSPDCKFGIYPMILKDLFDSRSQMKKGLHKWESEKELMDALPREEFIAAAEKYETVLFNFAYIDSKQKALKVFMNTFYGETGNKRSPFFVLQLAGAITSAGVKNIKMVEDFVRKEGCTVYYGDSVTGDTPLIVRDAETKMVCIKTIDDLVSDDEWQSYDQFKPGEPDRIEKQQGSCNLHIWTEGDWYDIRRVIRHKTNKKMYRVNTHTGCIDVTADHSMMRPDRTKIKPSELKIGTELMHSFPNEFPEILLSEGKVAHTQVHCNKCNTDQPEYEFYKNRTTGRIAKKLCRKCVWIENGTRRVISLMTEYFSQYEYVNSINAVTKEEAYVWGFFMADGSCGDYQCPSGLKRSWVINNQNIIYLNQAKDYLTICEPHLKFKLLDTIDSSGVYKLVANGHVKLIVEKYRKLFYDKRSYKLVPIQILNGSLEVRRSFYDGYYVGDGGKTIDQNTKRQVFCTKGKISAQCLYYLVKSLGYKYVSVRTQVYKPDIYWFDVGTKYFTKNPIAVKKIVELPEVTQDEFVYDIETSKGSFNGGVGGVSLKNTDSCYQTMPEKHFNLIDKLYYTGKMTKLEYWTAMVDITFKVISVINVDVNKMLIEDNGTKFLKLCYEESLYPVAFLAKKKYYGIPHISQANFAPKALFIRGLELKKRGVSEFLKKVCGNIMWDSVSLNNLYSLMQLVEQKIDEIYVTKWSFDDFIKTDVFKPNKQNVKIQTFAKRMLNEGVKVKPYERFSYVIVKKNPFKYDERGRKKTLMIGEKMEYSDRARELNMSIDLDYYMKGSINGQLARLIVYDDMFQVETASTDVGEMKKTDDKIYANACNWVENYCDKYYTNYQSKGKIYQKIFRMANKVVVDNMNQKCNNNLTSLICGNFDIENLEEYLETKAEKEALKTIKNFGQTYIENTIKDMNKKDKHKKITELQEIYFSKKSDNLLQSRERSFKDRQSLLQRQIKDNLLCIVKVFNYNTNITRHLSEKIKDTLNIDKSYNNSSDTVPDFDDLTEVKNIDETELKNVAVSSIDRMMNDDELNRTLNKLLCIYVNLLSNYNFIFKTRSIVDYLKLFRDKSLGLKSVKKDKFDTKKYIKDNVDNIISEM
jgi:DNA polymerase elongation subunit (family B)